MAGKDTTEWPPPTSPAIKTISDWYHALCRGDKIVSLPIAKGSGSLASRIAKGEQTQLPSFPPEYLAHDGISRLIELLCGKWPCDDPGVIKQAVRMVANHTNEPSEPVWRMTFVEFHDALGKPDVVFCFNGFGTKPWSS